MNLPVLTSPFAILPTAEPTPDRTSPLARIWRRKGLCAAVAAGVMALVVLVFLILPSQYLATGSVIVAEQEPGAENASVAWIQKLGDPADIESQLLVIRSPRLVRLAIGLGGLGDVALAECRHGATGGSPDTISPAKDAACTKLRDDPDALVALLQRRFLVAGAGRSRVINISYKSQLPDVAQTMVNTLIRAFLDDQKSGQAGSRRAATEWLRTEIRELDVALRDDEAAIQAFRRQKGLFKGATASISSERLTNITQQLQAADAAKAEAAARLGEIAADGGRSAANAPAVLASRAIGDLKQQLNALTAQLANSGTALGPNHPTIRALQTERASLQGRIDREVANIADSLRKSSQASSALAASLRAQLDRVRTEVSASLEDEAVLDGMVRNLDTKQARYADLVKRAGELETEQRILSGSSRLVSLADRPGEPVSPKPIPMLGGGLALAMVLGCGAALLRDAADRRVRSPAQVVTTVGAPVFAQLPQLGAASEPATFLERLAHVRKDLPLRDALRSAAGDPAMLYALRSLNARLMMAASHGGSCRILVTSAMPGEGKSFTTLAMAHLYATGRRRVLAIECDLRRPHFAAALGLAPGAGLSEVLRGEIGPAAALVRAGPNLDILPAGSPAPDSTDLLLGRRMEEVLRWSRDYDLILLDSPPAKLVVDASLLARQVDGILCCTRWGSSKVSDLVATVAALREAGGKVLGIAMTMAQVAAEPVYDVRPVAAPPDRAAA